MAKAGRPTLFKDEYAEQARKLCLLGLTDIELADFFGVNPDTIYEWRKVYPIFSEGTRVGKLKAGADVADKQPAKWRDKHYAADDQEDIAPVRVVVNVVDATKHADH